MDELSYYQTLFNLNDFSQINIFAFKHLKNISKETSLNQKKTVDD